MAAAHSTAEPCIPMKPVASLDRRETLKLQAMEGVVRKCHCFDGAFVFGGFVRDYIVNQVLPNDVDLSFKNVGDITTFLRILSELYEIDQVEKHAGYGWGMRRFETWKARVGAYGADGGVVYFTVDLVSGAKEDMASSLCDFTCNMLSLSRTGIELVSVPPSLHLRSSPIQDVLSGINAREFSVVEGKVTLLQSEVGPYAAKVCRRASVMVRRGWHMTRGKTFQAFLVEGPEARAECSICTSEFESGEVAIQTICHHHFHATCISKWLLEGRSTVTCPVCREEHFMMPAASIALTKPAKPAEADEADTDEDEDDSDYDPEDDENNVLIHERQKKRLRILYDSILRDCTTKIRHAAELKKLKILYELPLIQEGLPLYDVASCKRYLVKALAAQGFDCSDAGGTRFITISWKNAITQKQKVSHVERGQQAADPGKAKVQKEEAPPLPPILGKDDLFALPSIKGLQATAKMLRK
ncbi:hypothetical protein KFL_007120060 [Klebsormidium nitens]|uniref:RING-type E3 ubiquitin transferase n=1 Tax=Klebsormidium nitens TaxID=105231 RepID=A0A1Y1IP94_KLENI|nr:hypothetical protein KFL_007120060 [Klebsormidium nitens]|eukprot:GAQ91001.1 hypothetical protein KFL_007120060 [Klebsormidium nitens]